MDIDLDDVDLPTTKEKEMRDGSTEIFDKYGNKFIAFLEEDSDHNSELWSAFFGSQSSLPKKGDLVVYFPQGHLEYVYAGSGSFGSFSMDAHTYDLQPQIVCRVEHVQLLIEEDDEEGDGICVHITLHPEPEVNSDEKELEQSDEIEDCISNDDGRPATILTPSLFSKKLELSDIGLWLSIPPKAAIDFFCLDNESMDLQNEVTAKDFHGNEWKFPLIRDKKKGNCILGWSEFARARNLKARDRVVFLREKDTKLRIGIRRWEEFDCPDYFIENHFTLSLAAAAILKKSIFSVIYWPRGNHADFVIPYQKYMKSITRPGLIGAKFHKQYSSLKRFTGVVTGMADFDPDKWPKSKWKCLTVTWERSSGFSSEARLSPWEIVFYDSPPPRLILHQSSRVCGQVNKITHLLCLNLINITICYMIKRSDWRNKYICKNPDQSTFKVIQQITPMISKSKPQHPQTSSQFIPLPDSSSLTSLRKSKSTTSHKELIGNCAVDDLWLHLKGNRSYDYLEFDSCSFPSSTRLPLTITVKKLKITNCVDTEQVFTVLMDPKLSVESLEIDSCSSFGSISTGGIPVTLRQLKIVNCMNLKSLSKSFETEKSPSINERVHYSVADILELRKLEIQNCLKLESLPKGLHKLCNLDLLSINDCCSLEYFPEGGLPRTCLTSLSISECENLKCLPYKLHEVTSLQNLSISGCPSLKFFPEGGLPPNLVSLRIIDCENLISLSQWELHKLKHLRKYSFSCGSSDSGE